MGSDKTIQSEGSGFFISPDGYAVTNNHVVRHARAVTVTTYDGKSYAAKVVGSDPSTDLALLKINASTHLVRFARNLPHVGGCVLTVGDPFELNDPVTAGIVRLSAVTSTLAPTTTLSRSTRRLTGACL